MSFARLAGVKFAPLHGWDLSPRDAIALQRELARRVDTSAPLGSVRLVAGADISYERFSDVMFAGVVLLELPELRVVERAQAVRVTRFPYVPGLLSFREAPALLDAFAQLGTRPDVVVFDGQGIAHPRRLGIASHLGLWLDLPTVGCAKSLLIGRYSEPGAAAGSGSGLYDRGELVGEVLRTRDRVKPVFVSPGHRLDLASARRVILATCRGYRIPEPTRLAHNFVNELRRAA